MINISQGGVKASFLASYMISENFINLCFILPIINTLKY